eukprot:CAMPEP_0175749954 /NCGR_PEP_ID=MMETSP0097-20121207/60424_1 /TAXON_ID=311494 /ORGANISM="Alexandrium monilatum, Strain CCMP3105" /LENGTH=54 /DNA_ID=CAMNT_0017058541 /DNA_START=124 /DNA_END=285 /DNA_ORIENTATION=+
MPASRGVLLRLPPKAVGLRAGVVGAPETASVARARGHPHEFRRGLSAAASKGGE